MNTIAENIKNQFSTDIIDTKVTDPKRLIITIRNESLLEIANYFYEELKYRFIIASALLIQNGMEIYYHFSDDTTGYIISLDVLLSREKPEIESLANLINAANWIEREMNDLYGITFLNHPNPVPLIGAENWQPNECPYLKTRDE